MTEGYAVASNVQQARGAESALEFLRSASMKGIIAGLNLDAYHLTAATNHKVSRQMV